jgi:hypothetical protein
MNLIKKAKKGERIARLFLCFFYSFAFYFCLIFIVGG